jgi:RNA polymerase sigma factor (sigma-70 family)
MEKLFQKNEKILIEKIIAGDSAAENYLVSRFQGRITWLIRRKIGLQNDCWKDLVNDTILATLQSLKSGKFNPEKGQKLGSYIHGIANNKIRDFIKERYQFQPSNRLDEDSIISGDQSSVDEAHIEKERLQALRELLKKLKSKYQEVLYFRYYEGLSMKQIGDKLKKTEQQIINLHDYALKIIKKECKKNNFFSIFLQLLLIEL